MGKKSNAPDYFWLEPLRVLLNATAPQHPKFKWWHNIIGGSMGQTLYHTETFCAVNPPEPPDWSFENLVVYGPTEVLRQWAEYEIFLKYCDTGGGA